MQLFDKVSQLKRYFKYVKTLNKKALLVIAILLVGINFLYSMVFNAQLTELKNESVFYQENQVKVMTNVIERSLLTIYDDINVIRRSDEFSNYISDSSSANKTEVEMLFSRIAASKDGFTQIRYIDKTGMESIRVNIRKHIMETVEESDLQDKSNRYYFSEALNLSEEEMYVSEFDLNIENGVVVKPFEPTFRCAMPIYQDGSAIGVLVINYDGNIFLETLRPYITIDKTGHELGILDHYYYWPIKGIKTSSDDSYDPDDLKFEFSYKQNPVVNQIYERDHGTIQSDNLNYNFSTLHFEESPLYFRSNDHRWKVVSMYDFEMLLSGNKHMLIHYPFLRYVVIVFAAVISFMIYGFTKVKEENELMLKASSYISDYTHDGILIADKHLNILFSNQVFENMIGYNLEDLRGKSAKDYLKEATNLGKGKSGIGWEGNAWIQTREGLYMNKHLLIRTVQGKNGKPAYYIGIYSQSKINITDETIENLTNELPNYTEKYNLNVYGERMDTFVSSHSKVAAVSIRVHEFSRMTHLLPDYGETILLNNFTSELKSFINEEMIMFAPMNELVLILINMENKTSDIEELWRRIDVSISNLNYGHLSEMTINYSCGVSIYPSTTQSVSDLVNQSLIALLANTKVLQVPYVLYSENISNIVHRDLAIQATVENGLDSNEVYPVYQVQQNVIDQTIIGLEVLARWNSDQFGEIPPDTFIPLMEKKQAIKRLGIYMLKRVIEDFKDHDIRVDKDFKISVNLSSQEFMDVRVISEILFLMGQSQFELSNLCIEITESVILDNIADANSMIHFLNERGVVVAIDDFGTGFSSLSYLKQLKVNKLKIDRMFIMDYPHEDDGSILQGIVEITKRLRIDTIIEGVETETQMDFIRLLNCETAQGYHISKPVRIEELKTLL